MIELFVGPDFNPISPFEDCDTVKAISFASRYQFTKHDWKTPYEAEEWAKENQWQIFPLYAYIHGGIALSLSPFSCPWDSGQIGLLLLSPDILTIDGILDEYNAYLNGECYMWYAVENGETIDSCGGFYSHESAMEDARNAYPDGILRV